MRGRLREVLSEAEQEAGTMVANNLILLIFAATPVFSFYWFNGNSTLSPKYFPLQRQFDKIHLFSGPDIPIDDNNIDVVELTPESVGAPGAEGEEGALSNQDRFNWWPELTPDSSDSQGAGEGAATGAGSSTSRSGGGADEGRRGGRPNSVRSSESISSLRSPAR